MLDIIFDLLYNMFRKSNKGGEHMNNITVKITELNQQKEDKKKYLMQNLHCNGQLLSEIVAEIRELEFAIFVVEELTNELN
jgi:hypothetical protein